MKVGQCVAVLTKVLGQLRREERERWRFIGCHSRERKEAVSQHVHACVSTEPPAYTEMPMPKGKVAKLGRKAKCMGGKKEGTVCEIGRKCIGLHCEPAATGSLFLFMSGQFLPS